MNFTLGVKWAPTRMACTYTPTSNILVQELWLTLTRRYASWFEGTYTGGVESLTVEIRKVSGGQPDDSASGLIASGTILYNDAPTEYPLDASRNVLFKLTDVVDWPANQTYFVILRLPNDVNTNLYFVTWETGGDIGSETVLVYLTETGTWIDISSWAEKPAFTIVEEAQAGYNYHVVINGKGYMSPDNLHSAIEAGAVPFSTRLGSGDSLKYSQMDFPFSTFTQDSWHHGMGKDRLEQDPSGYILSANLDARQRNRLILAAKAHRVGLSGQTPLYYTDPDVTQVQQERVPFVHTGKSAYNAPYKIAQRITIPAKTGGYALTGCRIFISPTGDGLWDGIAVKLVGHDATNNQPDMAVVKASHTIANKSELDSMGSLNFVEFDASYTTNAVGEEVWLVLEVDTSNTWVYGEPVYTYVSTADAADTNYRAKYYDTAWAAHVPYATWPCELVGATQFSLDDDITAFAQFPNGDLYVGAKSLYKWDNTAGNLVSKWTGPAEIKDMVAFKDKIYFSYGYSAGGNPVKVYDPSTDITSTLQDDTPADVYGTVMTIANGYLWIATAKNVVRKWSGVAQGWGANITVGTDDTDITAIVLFQGQVHIVKENGVWYLDQDDVAHQRLQYDDQVMPENGKGTAVFQELMYIPIAGNVWRWTGATLDLRGPATGEFLPYKYHGRVVSTAATNSYLWAAFDGGSDKFSQVLAFDGVGWHPQHTNWHSGQRIRAIWWSGNLPSADWGRAWFGRGRELWYMDLPVTTDNPMHWDNTTYASIGGLITPWWDAGLKDVPKYIKEVRIEAEQFPSGTAIHLGYWKDNETRDWPPDYTFPPVKSGDELVWKFPRDFTCKSLRLNVGMTTEDETKSPSITAVSIVGLVRPSQAYTYSVRVALADNMRDLTGAIVPWTQAQLEENLKAAANSATPVLVSFPWGGFSGFISALSIRTTQYEEQGEDAPTGKWTRTANLTVVRV